LVILAFMKMPINLHVFDPVKAALSDVQFNDLAFSKINKETRFDDKIVIINIDTAKRKDIALLLNKLSSYKAAAVGLDLLFLKKSDDSLVDVFLGSEISKIPNLVIGEKLSWDSNKNPLIQNYYSDKSANRGFVNFIGEEKGVIRSYSPFETNGKDTLSSFTSAIIEKADYNLFDQLKERENEFEYINYRRTSDKYIIIDWLDIINDGIDKSMLSNKIVLVGFIDKTGFNIEDKHYTPLNDDFIHKKIPDMDGVIIHANILSMIIDGKFIKKVPTFLDILLAFLLTHLHMALFINYYIHNHKWFHIRFKAIHLLSSVIFIYICIQFLQWRCYFDFRLLLTAVVLSVDILYFYEGFANWLEKICSYKTIFTKSNH